MLAASQGIFDLRNLNISHFRNRDDCQVRGLSQHGLTQRLPTLRRAFLLWVPNCCISVSSASSNAERKCPGSIGTSALACLTPDSMDTHFLNQS